MKVAVVTSSSSSSSVSSKSSLSSKTAAVADGKDSPANILLGDGGAQKLISTLQERINSLESELAALKRTAGSMAENMSTLQSNNEKLSEKYEGMKLKYKNVKHGKDESGVKHSEGETLEVKGAAGLEVKGEAAGRNSFELNDLDPASGWSGINNMFTPQDANTKYLFDSGIKMVNRRPQFLEKVCKTAVNSILKTMASSKKNITWEQAKNLTFQLVEEDWLKSPPTHFPMIKVDVEIGKKAITSGVNFTFSRMLLYLTKAIFWAVWNAFRLADNGAKVGATTEQAAKEVNSDFDGDNPDSADEGIETKGKAFVMKLLRLLRKKGTKAISKEYKQLIDSAEWKKIKQKSVRQAIFSLRTLQSTAQPDVLKKLQHLVEFLKKADLTKDEKAVEKAVDIKGAMVVIGKVFDDAFTVPDDDSFATDTAYVKAVKKMFRKRVDNFDDDNAGETGDVKYSPAELPLVVSYFYVYLDTIQEGGLMDIVNARCVDSTVAALNRLYPDLWLELDSKEEEEPPNSSAIPSTVRPSKSPPAKKDLKITESKYFKAIQNPKILQEILTCKMEIVGEWMVDRESSESDDTDSYNGADAATDEKNKGRVSASDEKNKGRVSCDWHPAVVHSIDYGPSFDKQIEGLNASFILCEAGRSNQYTRGGIYDTNPNHRHTAYIHSTH